MTSKFSRPDSHSQHALATTINTKIRSSSRTSNPEQESKQRHSPTATSPSTSRWQPKVNRTQSLNEQDMKHQLQQRLTGLEKDRESGFTEIERGARRDKEGAMDGEGGRGRA
ncbi:hypothetical protein I7I48_08468 [Histoplasma ohiense]|nr:hypothetical protein I7I48_08468 [Histoplasma ohiense (nom. inval.)]